MCVDTSLTRVPIDAVRSTTGSATSGMDAPVEPGTVNWFGGVVPEVVTALS
jgi:hypothetical protein